MPRFKNTSEFDHASETRLGLLVSNLGTPDAPTAGALRKYLGEFLSDPRVIEVPKIIWWFILHGIILRIRPKRSARSVTGTAAGLIVISRPNN